jgi:pimeloyl-ACP methyl ester carboxylesterase
MGGFIVQTLAFRHPEIVRSAIISNSAMTPHCGFNFYIEGQFELLKSKTPLPAVAKVLNSLVYSYQFLSQPNMAETLMQKYVDNPFPVTLTGYEGQLAAFRNFDSRNWIHQINVPTLVLGSDQDLIFLEISSRALSEQIPSSKYHCFMECGHLPHVEYPDEFKAVFKKFIEKEKVNYETQPSHST